MRVMSHQGYTLVYDPDATAAKLNEAHEYWQENRR
jgi:hypothetical protein